MLTVPVLGNLSEHDIVPEWVVSEPIPVPLLGGDRQRFTLVMDAIGEERVSGEVAAAVDAFLSLGEADRELIGEKAFENYTEYVEEVEFEGLPVENPSEIWPFIHPEGIYVSRRHRRDRDIYVTVACQCDWEEEHGLQFVYRRGHQLVRVSDQDGHLTSADAYNRDDLEVGL